MDAQSIIAELEAERDRFNSALAALQGRTSSRGRGRITAATFIDGRKRHLSAAAKKRISDAMKKTWAARKKAA